jgi:predicted ester cyclase
MSSSYVEVIRAAVDRLNAGDVDGYLANFASDCPHWIAGSADPMPMPDFVASLHQLRVGLPDLQLEAVALFGVDNFVCAQWRTRGTHTGEVFGLPATGRSVCFDTAEVYELDAGGLVRASWAYADPTEMFAQFQTAQGAGR